jgi:Hint domain
MSESITQTLTVAPTLADWTQALNFGQFDPSLGTLVDVRIGIAGAAAATVAIENLGSSTGSFSVTIPSEFTVVGPDHLIDVSVQADPSASVNLGAYDGVADFAGSSGTLVKEIDDVQTSLGTLVSNLNQFTGTGSVALTVSDGATAQVVGDGNLETFLRTYGAASVSVTYDFNPATTTNNGTGGSFGGSGITLVNLGYLPFILSPPPGAITSIAQTLTLDSNPAGWGTTWAVSRFDPSLGSLLAVDITMNGTMIGSVAAENLASDAITYQTTQQASVSIALPDSLIAEVAYSAVDNMNLSAFDGSLDYGGISGRTDTALPAVFSGSQFAPNGGLETSETDPLLLAAFTGSGVLELPISSLGTSFASGGANMQSILNSNIGATIALDYVYLPAADPACFVTGTRIMTDRGPVPVELLSKGMRVTTAPGGDSLPIEWIGYRHVDCTRHPRPASVCPIRIRKDAFGEDAPSRDLLLSPDHAVGFDGALIPVYLLVNGHNIVRQPMDHVTYYHIELSRHALLLAENLPVESYLDTGNRSAFANGGAAVQLHPEFTGWVWEAAGCAPLIVTGPLLTRARLYLERAETATVSAAG